MPAHDRSMADPMPVAFALFAFALAVFGIRFVTLDVASLAAGSTSVAVDYAVLIAGLVEVLCGILGIIRGMDYTAYITTIFGMWLIGFFLLITSGAENKAFTPNAVAWYALVLIIPVLIIAVPAVARRNIPLIIAFVALLGLLLLVGLGYHTLFDRITSAATTKTAPDVGSVVNLLKASGWFAFVAAAAIWWVFAKEVYEITGVLKPRKKNPAPGSRVAPVGTC